MKQQLNEVSRLQKLAGIKKNLNESIEGSGKIGEENQMEADASWNRSPKEMQGKYQVKMDWRDDKKHFMDAVNAFKAKLGDVKFAGKFRKGNPNSPDGGVVTITGDSESDIINFLASKYGGGMGKKEAKEHMDEFGNLNSDIFKF